MMRLPNVTEQQKGSIVWVQLRKRPTKAAKMHIDANDMSKLFAHLIFNYNQVLGWWKLWYEHHNYLLFFIYCNPIFVIGIIIMTWTQTCTYTDYEIFFWKNIGNLVAPSKKKHLQRLKHINLTAIYTFFCFYYLIPFGYWYLDSDIDCR